MTDIPDARLEGGLWCHEVLEVLDAYVADELSPEQRAAADAHLTKCCYCARFGGVYGRMVQVLHDELSTPVALEDAPSHRLAERLQKMLANG